MSSSAFVTDYTLQHVLGGKGFIPGVGLNGGADSWDKHWRQALAQSKNRLVVCNILGDGITEGNYCSNPRLVNAGNSFVNLTAKALQAEYGDGGSGFQSLYDPSLSGNTYQYANGNYPIQLTNDGNVVVFGTLGNTATPNSTFIQTKAGGSPLLSNSVSVRVRGSIVTVHFMTSTTGGSAFVTVDNNPGVTVNTFDANNLDFLVVTFSGLSNTDHFVSITAPTATNVNCVGVGGYNQTGVVINRFSAPTLSARNAENAYIIQDGTGWGNIFANILGQNQVSWNSPADPLPYLKPDLFINALGTFGPTAQDNEFYLIDLFSNIREKAPTISIMTLAMVWGNFVNTLTVSHGSGVVPGVDDVNPNIVEPRQLVGRIRTLDQDYAAQFNAGFLDLAQYFIFGNSLTAAGNAGFFARSSTNGGTDCPQGQEGLSGVPGNNLNGIHPSDVGHRMIAEALVKFIAPVALEP